MLLVTTRHCGAGGFTLDSLFLDRKSTRKISKKIRSLKMNSEQDYQGYVNCSGRKRRRDMTEEERAERKEQKQHETCGERNIRKQGEREARKRSREESVPSDMLFPDDEEEVAIVRNVIARHDEIVKAKTKARGADWDWDEDSAVHHQRMEEVRSTMASENANSGRGRFKNSSSSSSSAACATSSSSSSSSSAMTSDQARARDYLNRPAALSRERPNVSDRVQDTQDELTAEKKRERTKHRRRQLEDERRFYPGAGLVGLNARVDGTRRSDRTLARRVMDYSNGQHASLPQIQNARNPAGRKRICLGDSRLPGGGTGLFALESFKAGDKVCPYGPAGSTPGCNNSDLMGVYSTILKQTFSGDESGERYYGGFINDDPVLGYNCMFMFQDVKTRGGIRQRLIIETTTDVDPGVEFSLYYGDEYWNRERTQRTSEIGETLPLGNVGDVAWETDNDNDSDA